MATASFNQVHKALLDEMLLADPRVRPGKMFGYPAYYVGNKLAICLYEQGVGVKLPEQRVAAILESDANVSAFQPLGRRKMREWIEIDLYRSEDYRRYEAILRESISYVFGRQEQ